MRGRDSRSRNRTSVLRRAAAGALVESLERRQLLAQSVWAFPGADGHMLYQPQPLGDHIEDFSNVGYMGGTVPIPNVPVMVTISPVAGDDEANIEAAIAQVAALPIDNTGFRGAVYLSPGEYDVAGTINISASGIVLRGAGVNQTIIRDTGTTDSLDNPTATIRIDGSTNGAQTNTHTVIDKYDPVGSRTLTLDSVSGYAVGDTIVVHRPSTQQWIHDIGMDLLDNPWTPGSKDINMERTITHIDGNVITLDAPLVNALDQKYTDATQGNNTVYEYNTSGRLNNVGVEFIGGISDYNPAITDPSDGFVDEAHSWDFIAIADTTNAWVRNVRSEHFAYSCVHTQGGSKWVTVTDSECLDPVSQITGGRRYSFANDDGTYILFKNLYTREGRHDYVEGSTVVGPNVFVDSRADAEHADAGPHHRWSTGVLWDNLRTSQLNIQDRGNSGTGHGHAGANQVVWNSQATGSPGFIVQSPVTAQNWLIGSIGSLGAGSGIGFHTPGLIDSSGPAGSGGANVDTRSLYYQQLGERMAYDNFDLREVRLGDADSYTNDGAIDNVNVDATWKSNVQTASGRAAVGFDTVANSQLVPFTFNFSIDPGTYIVGASLSLGLKSAGNSTAGDKIYFEDTSRTYTWSQLGITAPGTNASGAVIDLSRFLAALQDGKLNLAISGNTAIDWATLNFQTASTTQFSTATLLPVADAYVQDGTSANTNFGTATTVQTKLDTTNNNRESYLKFDLSALDPSIAITRATIRLTPTSVGYGANVRDNHTGVIWNDASFVSDDTWTENGLTWNNKPASSSLVREFVSYPNEPVNLDVTALVRGALAGDKALSMRLNSIINSSSGQISFGSKEGAAAQRPQLIIQSFNNALSPVADAYVRSGTLANSNFGTTTDLAVKQDSSQTSDNNREAFLKWDLAGVSTAPAGATVRLMPVVIGQNTPGAANWVTTDSWTEGGITWNNKPAPVTALGTWNLFPATPAKFDATAQVASTISGDKLFSAKVISNAVSTGVNQYASREYGDESLRPLLILKNLGPQVTVIPDVAAQKDTTSGPFWFGIWDAETATSSLSVSASSSNPTLIPNGNITFGGSAGNRTLTLNPSAGQTGNSTITITVTDAQGQTATTQFQYVVSAITGISATNNPDIIRVVRAGSNVNIYINDMGTPAATYDYATAPQLLINALDGADTITVDYTGGNPVPAAGLIIDGGADFDVLTALGTSGTDAFSLVSGYSTVNGGTFSYLNSEELDLTTNGGADTLTAGGNSSVTAAALGVNVTVGGSLTMNSGSSTPDVTDLLVANGTSFVLNGQNQTIDSLTGGGTVANNSGTSATLSVGAQGSVATFNGVLSNGTGAGALSLTKIGTGKLALTGANTYSGLTTITAGVLESGNSASLVALPGTIMLNGGTLHITADSVANNVVNKLNTNTGFAGTGGTIDVDSGVTLTIGTAGGLASLRTNGGGFHGGTFTKAGAGTLRILSNNGQLDDPFKLNAGTVIIESFQALGGADSSTNHVDMKTGTTLILRQDAATNFLTPISIVDASAIINVVVDTQTAHAGVFHSLNALSSIGAFTLNLTTGSNANSGASGLNLGAITLGGTGTFTINDGPAATTTLNVNGVISGAFGFTKNGLATMVLASTNTYTGTTTVDMGVLRLTDGGGLGATSAGTTINGGTSTGRVELAGGITVAEPFTLASRSGGINFQPHILNVGGTNTITGNFTLTTGGSYWTLQSDAGNFVIAGNLTNGNTTNTRTLYLRGAGAGQVTGGIVQTNVSLTQTIKEDAGTWTIQGNAAYTGPTTVNGGSLVFATDLTGSSAVSINNVGSLLELAPLGTRVLKTPALTIAGGELDLEDNKLIVTTAGQTGSWNGSVYTGITGLIRTGRNGGAWDGAGGIITRKPDALAGNYTTLAVAKIGDVRQIADSATTIFAGQVISGSATVVMYTYGGDANLDGKINIDDYTKIDNGIAGGASGWFNGDFNYDGKINIDDYTIIDANIASQGIAFPT